MFIAIMTFSMLLAQYADAHARCDTTFINNATKQIEIADYDRRATSPPPGISADLYSAIARKLIECANSPHHFMGTRIADLIAASYSARLSALAYFDAGLTRRGCAMLREAQRQSAAAAASSETATSLDKRYLKDQTTVDDMNRRLLASRCR